MKKRLLHDIFIKPFDIPRIIRNKTVVTTPPPVNLATGAEMILGKWFKKCTGPWVSDNSCESTRCVYKTRHDGGMESCMFANELKAFVGTFDPNKAFSEISDVYRKMLVETGKITSLGEEVANEVKRARNSLLLKVTLGLTSTYILAQLVHVLMVIL